MNWWSRADDSEKAWVVSCLGGFIGGIIVRLYPLRDDIGKVIEPRFLSGTAVFSLLGAFAGVLAVVLLFNVSRADRWRCFFVGVLTGMQAPTVLARLAGIVLSASTAPTGAPIPTPSP